MTETGLGGGVECSAHEGYHMREADLLFEIIDPVSGTPVRDGERGEIVFTTLTRRGMPLIRYRTDDISGVITEPCPCGSTFRRFAGICGRISDSVDLAEKYKLSMSMLDDLLFGVSGLVGFSAEIISVSGGNVLEIIVFDQNMYGVTDKVQECLLRDECIGEILSDGLLGLEIRQGGPEVLTYGNTKRRISYREQLI